MNPKSLSLFSILCTTTSSLVSWAVFHTHKVLRDNNISRTEYDIFSKFEKAVSRLWSELYGEIVKEIYENSRNNSSNNEISSNSSLPQPAAQISSTPSVTPRSSDSHSFQQSHLNTLDNFFIGKKQDNGSKSKRDTSFVLENERKTAELIMNGLFLEIVDDYGPSFLSSYSRYKDDMELSSISSQSHEDIRNQFFVQSTYFLHQIFVTMELLLSKINVYVSQNKSKSSWKFNLNKKYFDFLKKLFDEGKDIFSSIKYLSTLIPLLQGTYKSSHYSNFFLPVEGIFDINRAIKNIEILIGIINFESTENNFKNYYEDFNLSKSNEQTQTQKDS